MLIFGCVWIFAQLNVWSFLDSLTFGLRVAKCQILYTDKNLSSKFTPKTRNSWLICFRDKTRKSGQSKSLLDWFASFVVQLDIFIEFGLNVNVPGLKSPHWNRIWAKCTGVWGKITPTKLAVFTKLYPTSELRMLHSKILPQIYKKFTQIYLPYLWHFATLFGLWTNGTLNKWNFEQLESRFGRSWRRRAGFGTATTTSRWTPHSSALNLSNLNFKIGLITLTNVADQPVVEPCSRPDRGRHPPPLPLAPRLRRPQLLRRNRLWTCLQVTGKHFAKYSCWDFDISHRSDNDIIGELHQRVSALEDSEVALRDTYGSPYRCNSNSGWSIQYVPRYRST